MELLRTNNLCSADWDHAAEILRVFDWIISPRSAGSPVERIVKISRPATDRELDTMRECFERIGVLNNAAMNRVMVWLRQRFSDEYYSMRQR